MVESSFDEASGYAACEALLDRWGDPPTAVAVWSVAAAIGLIAGLAARGLRVPQDVSVVAFHDAPIAAFLQPALTTVRMPLGEMAAMGVEALLRQIAGESVESFVVQTEPAVVVRSSTCAPAGRPAPT